MKFTTKVVGLSKIIDRLSKTPSSAVLAAASGMYVEAEKIMSASKPLVPVDTGALRSTGHVQLPQIKPDKIVIELGYGGVAGAGDTSRNKTYRGRGGKTVKRGDEVGYAVRVHEDLTAHHEVGQAKYLEQPFNAAKKGMGERLAQFISRRTGIDR